MSHQLWPQCAKCSMDRGENVRVPVESYEVERDRGGDMMLLEGSNRGRLRVRAWCSHSDLHTSSGEHRRRKPEEQTATIDVPLWWSDGMVLDAIKSLRFFVPGQGAPTHTLVERFS